MSKKVIKIKTSNPTNHKKRNLQLGSADFEQKGSCLKRPNKQ
jgi:hypothetical protein